MKKWMIPAVCLLLIVLTVLPVAALEEPDMSRKGSVLITMSHEGEPVPGGTLTLVRVAQVHEENGADYSFRLLETYLESGVSLEEFNTDTAEALAAYTAEKQLTGEKKPVDAQGQVLFTDLELGLYLVLQEDAAPGYALSSPFLVSVPGRQDDRYVYEVDASPKLALETVPTEPPTEPSTPPSLPQTGQLQWPIPVMVAMGVVLVATGIVIFATERKGSREK